jgi:hypothetical protein
MRHALRNRSVEQKAMPLRVPEQHDVQEAAQMPVDETHIFINRRN